MSYNEIAVWVFVGVGALVMYCAIGWQVFNQERPIARPVFWLFFPFLLVIVLLVSFAAPRRS